MHRPRFPNFPSVVSLRLAELRLTLNFNDVKSCNEAAVRDSDSALNSLNVTIPRRFLVSSFRIIHPGGLLPG